MSLLQIIILIQIVLYTLHRNKERTNYYIITKIPQKSEKLLRDLCVYSSFLPDRKTHFFWIW